MPVSTRKLFGNQANSSRLEPSFKKFHRLYWSGRKADENSLKRLSIIKWQKPVPTCAKCGEATVSVKRRGRSAPRFRCKSCPGRPEVSFLTGTSLKKSHLSPNELLICSFYVANCTKPRAVALAAAIGKDRATVTRLIRFLREMRDMARLKRIKNNDRYRRRAFKLCRQIVR
jgi:transposase-like protein